MFGEISALDDAARNKLLEEMSADPLQLLHGSADKKHWQVGYTRACGMARVYASAKRANLPEDTSDAYAKAAVVELEAAIRTPDFALARWGEDVLDLITLDPDLTPLDGFAAFAALTATLTGTDPQPAPPAG